MNIGFDMDEILAELTIGFQKYLVQNHNVHLSKEKLMTGGLEKELRWTHEQVLETLYYFFYTDLFKNLSPVPYSREGIEVITKEHSSYIITARSQSVYDQTKYWIDNNLGSLITNFYLTSQWPVNEKITTKPEVCKMLNVEVMVEDSLRQAYDCAKNGVNVLLLDYPWNQVSKKLQENIKRVYSWKEIVGEIDKYGRTKKTG